MLAAPVTAVTAGTAWQHGLAAHAAGMNRAEGGRGQGREHAWMRGDRVGDALAPGQARFDELASVALVSGRAGWADVLAAIAARDQQHAVRFVIGAVHRPGLAGGKLDGTDLAA